jgi:hypothetical protein
MKRNRIIYCITVLLTIISGLLSRHLSSFFPIWINAYLGDALWALMVYQIFAIILNSRSIKTVAIYSIIFCYLIEITQLYHAPWIDSIRSTTLGGLVLGYGFLWSDILAYSIGVMFGAAIEILISKKTGININ